MTKRFRQLSPIFVFALLAGLCLRPAAADDAAQRGREILDRYKTAVITVEIVVKLRVSAPGMSTQEQENKQEVTGTVIGADGLTLVALSAMDPMSMYKEIMPQREDFNMESEISAIKLLLDDGTEVPAKEVIRDKELDLAFLRPIEKPAQPMPSIDLTQSAAPQILDEVISLNRLGKVARRVNAASVERIDAIVSKPRTYYIPGRDPSNTTLGSPAFTLDGKIVGVFVLRAVRSDDSGGMFGGMGGNDNVTAIIVPAADILEGARQAQETAP